MIKKYNMHLMIIEDNDGDVILIREALKERNNNYTISVIVDGHEAMQFLRKEGKYKEAKTPDLILMDLNLPKTDGKEVLANIKSDPKLKFIPVIVFSSSVSGKDISDAYNNHANCYVTKEADIDSFIRTIKQIEEFWTTIVRLPGK